MAKLQQQEAILERKKMRVSSARNGRSSNLRASVSKQDLTSRHLPVGRNISPNVRSIRQPQSEVKRAEHMLVPGGNLRSYAHVSQQQWLDAIADLWKELERNQNPECVRIEDQMKHLRKRERILAEEN